MPQEAFLAVLNLNARQAGGGASRSGSASTERRRCARTATPSSRSYRVLVLRRVRELRFGACARTAAASSSPPAAERRRDRRSPPLRAPPVLRTPLRLLRLRHRGRQARRARRLRRRAARRAGARAAPARRPGRDRVRRRRHAHLHRAGRARAGAGRATTRPRDDGRGEPGDGHARARRAAAPWRGQPGLARRAELPGAAARGARAARRPRRRPRAPSPISARCRLRQRHRSTSIYGIPGQSAADLERDLAEALALEPEHLSCYELEAKPGTRFTHAHGDELARQAEAMEGYFERVVERLTGAGYRWYETANFCLPPERAGGRDLRARHNLGYWLGRDYLGVGDRRRLDVAGAPLAEHAGPRRATSARSGAGERPPRELEPLDAEARRARALLLGLRLDEPLPLAGARACGRPDGARPARAARAARTARGDGGGARADPPRPLPRRRRHRRAAGRAPSIREDGADVDTDRPRKREILRRVVEEYVSTGRPVGLEGARRAGRAPGLVLDGARTSSPSSSASACSRTRTPAPAACRPRAATGSMPTGCSSSSSRGPPAFPLDLTAMRSEVESALQATTEMLAQVTRLLALVSAPPLADGDGAPRRGAAAAADRRDGRRDHLHRRRRRSASARSRRRSTPASRSGRAST